MTFAELQIFLSDWYDTPADALGVPHETLPAQLNETVRQFYLLFGALAQRASPFGHTASHFGPLSAQDNIYPADELKLENGCYIHLMENQGVFAAASRPGTNTVLVKGDVGEGRYSEFVPSAVPLEESLVACALMETVMSVGDRERLVTADDAHRNRAHTLAGSRLSLRTVHSECPLSFWFAPDMLGFGFEDQPEVFARKGQWRQKPPTFQDIEFEGGGSLTSGPTNPTPEQAAERAWTLNEARRRQRKN